MEHLKIFELLSDSTVSKFVTRKWIEENDLSNGQYSVEKNIRFKNPMLRSDLCDYSDAYVVVKGRITVADNVSNNQKIKNYPLSIMLHFGHTYQKSITHS